MFINKQLINKQNHIFLFARFHFQVIRNLFEVAFLKFLQNTLFYLNQLIFTCQSQLMQLLNSAVFILVFVISILCKHTNFINNQYLHQLNEHKDDHTIKHNKNIAHLRSTLLILLNHGTQASRSLCNQHGLKKCGKICCLDEHHYFSHRIHQKNIIIQNQSFSISEQELIRKELCENEGKVMCGKVCCSNNNCEIDENPYNIRTVRSWCRDEFISRQNQCKRAGLLWCDWQCCGFSAHKHKCFKTNHYGTPYIRCPIQDPAK